MKFSADKFFALGQSLGSLERLFSSVEQKKGRLSDESIQQFVDFFRKHGPKCNEIGLRQSFKAADRAANEIAVTRTAECIHQHLKFFFDVANSEMEDSMFWHVPYDLAEWFSKDALSIMGEDAFTRFKSARGEFEEAAKCYALERPTACVFHLMRAVEIIMKALFKSGRWTPSKLADSWGAMLGPMDGQFHKPAVPVAVWQSNLGFFAQLVSDLKSIKRVYRDTTMHVESTHTQPEAKLILEGVVSLFQHAAKHLDEDGNFTP